MSRQFKVPVNLVQLTTDPSTALAGDIYFNSVSSKIKFYSGTEWLEVGAGAGGGTTNHTHDYNGNVIVGAGGSIVTTATFAPGVPNNLNGQNGDVYLDITNLDVYVKSSGVWGTPTEVNVYTKSEVDTLLAGKSATGHTHTLSNITDITASAAELNVLDGITATTAELNILDGITATTAEINYIDGVTSPIQSQLNSKVSSTDPYFSIANFSAITSPSYGYLIPGVSGLGSLVLTQVPGISATPSNYYVGKYIVINIPAANSPTFPYFGINGSYIISSHFTSGSDQETFYLNGFNVAYNSEIGPLGYSGPGSVSIGEYNQIGITAVELSYLDGLASNIQDQLDSVGNSLGDYIPLAALGVASGVAETDANGNILVPTSPAGAGIKFADNTIQTTAINTSSFATSSQLSDVEVLALAGL